MYKYFLITALFFFGLNINSQPQLDLVPMDDIQISLLTCDPGDALYSTFGHSAIRVLNSRTNQDIVYNYGTFDTNTPNFYLKFMRGKLPYMLARSTYGNFLNTYHYEKRSIVEQILQLNTKEEKTMVAYLENNMVGDNRYYPYDFFFDNCATRIRDIIPSITDKKIQWPEEINPITYREQLHQHLTGMPWSEFGIDLIIGSIADKNASISNQMFLPNYLHDHFATTELGYEATSSLLASEDYKVLLFEEEAMARKKKKWFNPFLIFGLLLILELFLFLKIKDSKALKVYDTISFFGIGLASVLMLLLWFATDHQATGLNWNILWASPLYLIYPFITPTNTWKKYLTTFLIIATLLSLANMAIQFLPQYFNSYNIFNYFIILLKLWRQVQLNKITNA